MKSAYRQDYQPPFSAIEVVLANAEESARLELDVPAETVAI